MAAGSQRTLLGFDYGVKKIGVAIGQEITCVARELTTLPCSRQQPDWQAIQRLIDEWRPDALVVGVPYHMDGQAHDLTDAARRFGRQLHGRFRLPVFEVDERLSSREARSQTAQERATGLPGRHGPIDQIAARVILQDWLRQQEACRER